MNYQSFMLGYDLLQTQLNHYDIPCDIAYDFCYGIAGEFNRSPEYKQDKSEYECLQDYVNNHMHEIELSLIELVKKCGEYDETINIESTAKAIYDRLQYCDFDDITDSSGYFLIKQFEDGTDRAVDVYKSTNDGEPHYVIYISYEDDDFNYKHTKDLSLEELIRVLKEISTDVCEIEKTKPDEIEKLLKYSGCRSISELWDYIDYLEEKKKDLEELKSDIFYLVKEKYN